MTNADQDQMSQSKGKISKAQMTMIDRKTDSSLFEHTMTT